MICYTISEIQILFPQQNSSRTIQHIYKHNQAKSIQTFPVSSACIHEMTNRDQKKWLTQWHNSQETKPLK